VVDLRSDTVTVPTEGMRAAMARAEVGDDVYGEDPTCRLLEERVAALLGKPAALFTTTGSMANLLGVHALVRPGEEVLCESRAHIARAELGAHATIFGVTTRTWPHPRGLIDLAAIESMLAPKAGPHLVSTAAVSVENTHNFGGGAIQSLDDLRRLRDLTARAGLGLHLDGARLWNASVASGVSVREYAEQCDVVSVCLSKGLGAPIGSLVVGTTEQIAEARVWRKRLGGGWRQAGVLAAAGLYALDHHVERLAEDHAHARLIAETLADASPGVVDVAAVETNIVVLDLAKHKLSGPQLVDLARSRGVLVGAIGPSAVRLLTHLGVDEAACRRAAEALARILSA